MIEGINFGLPKRSLNRPGALHYGNGQHRNGGRGPEISDELKLIYLLRKMIEDSNIPRSKTMEELRQTIGKGRIKVRFYGFTRFTNEKGDRTLFVAIGYKNLRAFGYVDPAYERYLEKLGRMAEVEIEVASVNDDEKDPRGDFNPRLVLPRLK